MRLRRTVFGSAVVVMALLFTSCKDDPASPGIQPEIVNSTDHFSYQVSNVQNYTATLSYPWQNTGTQLYSRSLADNGTFTTSSGTAGAWTIRVVFNSASGTLNFRADRTT